MIRAQTLLALAALIVTLQSLIFAWVIQVESRLVRMETILEHGKAARPSKTNAEGEL